MIREDFEQLIKFEEGRYISKKENTGFLRDKLPTLRFYPPLIRIILRSSRLAKKGEFDEKTFYKESFAVFRLLEKVGVEFQIEGIENVKNCPSQVVFIGNHMSTLETFILPLILIPFTPISFVVKKSLVEYPVFGHIMRAVKPITVTRVNPREDLKKVLDDGCKMLSEGRSIIVFPQTTRKIEFNESEFNTIGIKLAKRADVPVIPFALKTDAWQNGKLIKDFGPIDNKKRVYFSFGEPISIESKGDIEHKRVIEFISNKLKEFK
ncbi:MAG: 1-acyl-sn-glycerol-3-phosphate acyltransferase [Proteobacteria bacterium]|nr:1-acyl-sn-glycerol-3-phosphate acyltransferase [Pseudomonadota bacterium]